MATELILAIDPGNIESAYCFVERNTYKPVCFEKAENYEIKDKILEFCKCQKVKQAAIEDIACYGMAVSRSVFDTCKWIGRFTEALECSGVSVSYIYRKDEKMAICGQMTAKDSNIRTALIDRFAKFDFKNGKGTKKCPDWFFGFKADIWAAYAVATTYLDIVNGRYITYD